MPQFPSAEWLDAVRRSANADPQFTSQGSCNCVMGVKVGGAAFAVTFEGFECAAISEADPVDMRSVDFYIDMTPAQWRDFIENIAANGGADSEHTLNTLDLTLPDGCVKSHDELRRAAFFQYHLSAQAFFDASARVETAF